MIQAFHNEDFAAPIGAHIMPMRKFSLVAAGAREMGGVEIVSPAPVTEAMLARVHAPGYINAVKTGEPRGLAESQKFPWSDRLFPSVLLTNGAVLEAGRAALRDGVAVAVASGFHHAHAERGEGFCTFNGLVVAAEQLRAEKAVERVAVLDLDLHYGNGTALLARTRPWLSAWSIYGNDYGGNVAFRDVTVRQHVDGENHRSYALPAGCDGAQMREILARALDELLAFSRPDLVLYQAGADPFREDPYSPLLLDYADIEERDAQVFTWAKKNQLPIAWTLAGGYTPEIEKIIRVHLGTFRAARAIFGS